MFPVTVLEILLWKAISVFWPAQWSTECKRVKVTVENQKCIGNLFELLEKWLTYKIKRFWMVFKFFRFCLSLSVAQKLVLWLAQWSKRSERFKVSIKNQKNIVNLWELLKKWLIYKLMRFWIVFRFFLILFNPFNTEKIEKLDLWDANKYTNHKYQ